MNTISGMRVVVIAALLSHCAGVILADGTSARHGNFNTRKFLSPDGPTMVANGNVSITGFLLQEFHNEVHLENAGKEPVNKLVLALISLFHFGFWGIDRCFAGQYLLGIAKGFTCGGFLIWWMIDYCIILFNCLLSYDQVTVMGWNHKFSEPFVGYSFYFSIFMVLFNILSSACAPKNKVKCALRRNGIVSSNPTAEEIASLFHMWDADGSGSIDTKEIQAAMAYLGVPVTDDEAKKMIKECDFDGNGTLDMNEFTLLVVKGK